MAGMAKVVLTDYVWESLEVEKKTLAGLADLVALQTKKPAEFLAEAQDCDALLNTYAGPITAADMAQMPKEHWEAVYQSKSDAELSWTQPEPGTSLALIAEVCPGGRVPAARVIDVGGGTSLLAGRLLDRGYSVTLLDISEAAIDRARHRLGARASQVGWMVADVTADPEERARHLALGTTGADADVADALDAAARHARGRGSREGAAEFAELAIGRTPLECTADLRRRRVTAAEYQFHLGHPDRARTMVMASQEASDPGPERVPGLLLLATIDYWTSGSATTAQWCDQAMREAGSDRMLMARCHAAVADMAPYAAAELLGHARTAVELMGEGDDAPPDVLASALKNVAYHELRLGHGLSLPLLERAAVAEAQSVPVPIIERVGMCLGMLLRFAGQFADARRWLLQMRQSAEDEGDDSALPNILGHLALLECWVGDYALALRYASEGLDLSARTGVGSPSVTAAHALAEAHLGHIDEARHIALAALAHDESQGEAADVACDLRSIGFAELSGGRALPSRDVDRRGSRRERAGDPAHPR